MDIITDDQARDYLESGRYLVINEAGFCKIDNELIAFNFHRSNDAITTVHTITEALKYISHGFTRIENR